MKSTIARPSSRSGVGLSTPEHRPAAGPKPRSTMQRDTFVRPQAVRRMRRLDRAGIGYARRVSAPGSTSAVKGTPPIASPSTSSRNRRRWRGSSTSMLAFWQLKCTTPGSSEMGSGVDGAGLLEHLQPCGLGDGDDLQHAVVYPRHGRHVHAGAEVGAVADGDHASGQRALLVAAVEHGTATHLRLRTADDGTQGGRIVGHAAGHPARRGLHVPVDEAAHAGRDDIDEEALAGAAVIGAVGETAHVHPALAAGRDRLEVVAQAVLDAERAPEVAAGALRDQADAHLRGAAAEHHAVDHLAEGAVAADGDDAARGPSRRPPGPARRRGRDARVNTASTGPSAASTASAAAAYALPDFRLAACGLTISSGFMRTPRRLSRIRRSALGRTAPQAAPRAVP